MSKKSSVVLSIFKAFQGWLFLPSPREAGVINSTLEIRKWRLEEDRGAACPKRRGRRHERREYKLRVA